MSVEKIIDRLLGGALVRAIGLRRSRRRVPDASAIRNALLIKYRAIGDSIATLPLLRALHGQGIAVDVLAHASNARVFEGQRFVRKLVAPSPRLLFARYDLVIDAEPWSNLSAVLAWELGRHAFGFSQQPRSRLYSATIIYDKNQHITETYADFARLLGIKVSTERMSLALTPDETARAAELLAAHGLAGKRFMVVAVGVGLKARCRRWPAANWAALAAQLEGPLVFIGHGPADAGDVAEVFAQLSEASRPRCVNLVGQTNLGVTAALIAEAACFVGCDSGPLHVASVMNTPTVGLYGANTPVIWGPRAQRSAALFHKNPGVPLIDNTVMEEVDDKLGFARAAMEQISVGEVVRAIREVAGGPAGTGPRQ
ncbi:MAG: glycosyltransferase family 9 protein [Verrucomicrobia bacterium]|nr:glycosyltransferase family 9 protein [Verrucomicrobiota bacterium]